MAILKCLGSFKLGPIPGFNNNGANSKAKEGKQALALAKPMTADAVSIGNFRFKENSVLYFWFFYILI